MPSTEIGKSETSPTNKISRYNALWPLGTRALEIEMACIRKGGKWEKDGKKQGNGLAFHYDAMRKILWPSMDNHRWMELCLKEAVACKILTLIGAGATGKTHFAAWFSLCQYYCSPDDTIVLISSTDIRGLELRVWGAVKHLHEEALSRHDVPGNLIDSKHAITTNDVEEESVRDMRSGVVGIPTISGGKSVGLGKWLGVHQKHVRLVADEAQFMGSSFLSAFSNLNNNVDFKAICIGNPHEFLDPLGKAAEPKDGWSAHLEPEKTAVWDTRFMDGRAINLVGTDSPNFDYPENEPTRFPYLISREKIAATKSFFSEDSFEYYSQCKGVMRVGMLLKRVITRDLCVQFQAMSRDVVWDGKPKRICGLDAAYGGDRCMCGHLDFGKVTSGKMMVLIYPPSIVPIKVSGGKDPEEQIADWVKDYCRRLDIRPEDFFHDSTGRGSLGTALARVWSAQCNPVEFGGTPTTRPVSLDLFIWDYVTKRRRLKRCDEHYSKFVTELWFTIRYAIEAGQIRGLPEEMMEELCMREWSKVKGDKIEIESKVEMKERVGRSPDIGDLGSILLEGARQRGFSVSKLGNAETEQRDNEWLKDLARSATTHTAHELVYS